jgi:hypothetical protein
VKNKLLILTLPLLFMFLYACATTSSIVASHPEKVTGMPDCTECHTDAYGTMNHTAPDFMKKHGIYGTASRLACSTCHHESFCADCHARKDELKPSEKFADSPERFLPHRGDYLGQHKIDGRIDPSSCSKCHGRYNNERCATCHK